MCCEDLKIGRASNSSQATLAIAAASTPFVPGNPDRTALVFIPPPSGTLTVSMAGVAVAGEGIVLVAGNDPVQLNIQHDGDLVRRPWTAIHSVGGVNCTYLETSVPTMCK